MDSRGRSKRYRLFKKWGVGQGGNEDSDSDDAETAEPRPRRLRLHSESEDEELQNDEADIVHQVNASPASEAELGPNVNQDSEDGDNDFVPNLSNSNTESGQEDGGNNNIDENPNHNANNVQMHIREDDDNNIEHNIDQLNRNIVQNPVADDQQADDYNIEDNANLPNDNSAENSMDEDQNPADGDHNVSSSSNSEPSESEEEDEPNESDDSSDQDEEEHQEAGQQPDQDYLNDDRPIYPDAQVTLRESVIAILTFILSHHLTGNGLVDLLALIILHCPVGSRCVKSLYSFQKFFKNIGKEIVVCHFYCSVCYKCLPNRTDNCTQCNRATKVNFFIEIPIVKQLQIFLKRPGFYNDLQFRFNRVKKNLNNVEDIYDGNIYKEHVQSGFLRNANNISFMWYTDGVSVFNISNKFSIWPLYLVINELCYKKRVKKENIILAGIWFGKKKPKANTFLEPFHTRMEDFYQNGHLFHRSDGPPVFMKGVMLCGTCDMPAKSTFLRMKQFNGYYGCPKCLQKGERYQDTTVHIYRYIPNPPVRSNESVQMHARVALASGFACCGVKGISHLYRMVSDLVRSTGIDAMHGIFSGLGKALLEYWFHHKDTEFSLQHCVNIVDARLKQFKVPSFLNKFPQSVSDLSSWKSLDYKVWLLYYSVPVLSGLMPDIYLDHHMLLVSAVFILSQRSISPRQIDQASDFLNKYVSEFANLYHPLFMGINVHQLTHLGQCVKDLGPLWVYSCYFMEDLNGKICKFIHGTSHVGFQIASATTKMQKLESLISSLDLVSPAYSFCNKVNKCGQKFKIAEVISPGVNVVGKFSHILVPPRQILLQCLNIQGGHCQLFTRLWSKGTLYVSESYTRALKRQSSYVHFTLDDASCLGSIKYFVRWSNCHCNILCRCQPCSYLCVIQVYERVLWRGLSHPDNLPFSYLSAVRDTLELVAIPVSSLRSLCFYLSINNGVDTKQYIIERVNNLEAE